MKTLDTEQVSPKEVVGVDHVGLRKGFGVTARVQ